MNIKLEDFISHYPEIYDQNFYQEIYQKKEFYDLKLKSSETLSSKPGELANHQKIVSRFISPYTDYNSLLLVHEMGTGKTCSAVGIIEGLKKTKKYIHAMIFAPSENLLDNFKEELVHRCTGGNYIPENYSELTQQEKVRRINKLTDFYEFNTFETFAKELAGMSDKNIQLMYSNRIFVIDEVHNMIQVVVFSDENKQGPIKLSVYDQFYRLLHCTTNTKIILLTGTPMQNSPAEIASIMNLIIGPGEQPMPGDEKSFMAMYFPGDHFVTDPTVENKFRSFFKGKVSYLKSIESEVKKEYVGDSRKYGMKDLILIGSIMSTFQEKIYTKSYNDEARGFYSSARQTSLFVFPDESYGQAGFQKYITQYKKNNIIHYRLKEELRQILTNNNSNTSEEILKEIQNYSCKYFDVINNILNCKGSKKVFVFGEFVYGCGIILFSCLLKLFGYEEAESDITTKKPRFVLAITSTLSTRELKNVIEKFNSPENSKGEYIQILIGSKIVSEGYTFKDIQVVEILTPHWNYSVTSQAIARGYRFGSHRNLINQNLKPEYKIYHRVAVAAQDNNNIDIEMYKICEEKNQKIQIVEKIIKEMAFDCQLNFDRNSRGSHYYCYGIVTKHPTLDYSTFLGPYGIADYDNIKKEIKLLFSENFFISKRKLYNWLGGKYEWIKYEWIQILKVLSDMISMGETVTDRYGFQRYLKVQNNIYFLSEKIFNDTFFSAYYLESPNIIFPSKKLEYFVKIAEMEKHESDLNNFWELRDEFQMIQIIQKLSPEQKSNLFEKAAEANEANKKLSNPEKFLLMFFENYYKKFDGEILVSWILMESQQIVRQFNPRNQEWISCDKDNLFFWAVENYLKNEKERIENNPYKCYGQYSKYTDDFCIRDINIRVDKKHKQTSGKRCSNWDKHELINLIVNRLQIELSDDQILECDTKYRKKSKNELYNMLTKFTTIFPSDNEELIKKALIFYGMRRENLCSIVRSWFKSKNLLVEDSKCGVQGKEKI